MSWTTPATFVNGTVITASDFNEQIRDNLRYLKGMSGSVEIEDDVNVPNLITSGLVDGVDVSSHATLAAMSAHTGGIGDHDHSASGSEGGQLSASVISTGRFTLDNMPVGDSGYYLKGTGSTTSPEYAALAVTMASSDSFSGAITTASGYAIEHTYEVASNVKNIGAAIFCNSAGAGDINLKFDYNGSTVVTKSQAITAGGIVYTYAVAKGAGAVASAEFSFYSASLVNVASGNVVIFTDYIS